MGSGEVRAGVRGDGASPLSCLKIIRIWGLLLLNVFTIKGRGNFLELLEDFDKIT